MLAALNLAVVFAILSIAILSVRQLWDLTHDVSLCVCIRICKKRIRKHNKDDELKFQPKHPHTHYAGDCKLLSIDGV